MLAALISCLEDNGYLATVWQNGSFASSPVIINVVNAAKNHQNRVNIIINNYQFVNLIAVNVDVNVNLEEPGSLGTILTTLGDHFNQPCLDVLDAVK